MSGSGQTLFRGLGANDYFVDEDFLDTPPSAPPMVSADVSNRNPTRLSEDDEVGSVNTGSGVTGTSVLEMIFGKKSAEKGVAGGLVDIFGRIFNPGAYQPAAPPPPASTPMWVYLAIPVVLIGAVALIRRKPRAVAGYRRRRSRK